MLVILSIQAIFHKKNHKTQISRKSADTPLPTDLSNSIQTPQFTKTLHAHEPWRSTPIPKKKYYSQNTWLITFFSLYLTRDCVWIPKTNRKAFLLWSFVRNSCCSIHYVRYQQALFDWSGKIIEGPVVVFYNQCKIWVRNSGVWMKEILVRPLAVAFCTYWSYWNIQTVRHLNYPT